MGINNGSVSRSYASGVITMNDAYSTTGAFVGQNSGTIDQSYAATGYTNGYSAGTNPNLAGFVWQNTATGVITNAYSTYAYSTGATAAKSDFLSVDCRFVYNNAGTISSAYATDYSRHGYDRFAMGFCLHQYRYAHERLLVCKYRKRHDGPD